MIARRVLIGLLITLFLPAPRGNELYILLNLHSRFLALFQNNSDACATDDSDNIVFNVVSLKSLEDPSGYPVDLFDGLLENEIEKELEEDEGKDDKNSKYNFLSVLIQFHFDHELKLGYMQSGYYMDMRHNCSSCLVLRC